MELLTALVADAANKGEGDKLNVLGIFHQIGAEAFPTVVPHVALAVEFEAQHYEQGKTFDIKIVLLDPSNTELVAIDANLSINSDAGASRTIVPFAFNIHNLVFPVAGSYRFEVRVNGSIKGSAKLDIIKVGAPSLQAVPATA